MRNLVFEFMNSFFLSLFFDLLYSFLEIRKIFYKNEVLCCMLFWNLDFTLPGIMGCLDISKRCNSHWFFSSDCGKSKMLLESITSSHFTWYMGKEFPTGYSESFLFLLFLNDKENSNLCNKVKDAQNEGSSSLGPMRLHGETLKWLK